MNPEIIGDLLRKLNEKTGREWSLQDLMRLAEMLSNPHQGGVQSVMDEVERMGLPVPEHVREEVVESLGRERPQSPESAVPAEGPGKEDEEAPSVMLHRPLRKRRRKRASRPETPGRKPSNKKNRKKRDRGDA